MVTTGFTGGLLMKVRALVATICYHRYRHQEPPVAGEGLVGLHSPTGRNRGSSSVDRNVQKHICLY